MKYVIAGTGGVGGCIAGFLSLADKDVTCIARGEHLKNIQEHGLILHSTLKGEHVIPIKACTAEEYKEKADVIFVCVKGYSINSITDMIARATKEKTVVIPILNVYGTGPKIQRLVPKTTVLDGCIYIVGFVSNPGEVTQMGNIFRLIYGAHRNTNVSEGILDAILRDLTEAGINAQISDDINRDTFAKWSFISAMACTGAYYDVPMGEVQKEGEIRETFRNLVKESSHLGETLGIRFNCDMISYSLKVIDSLAPESTASLQKDIAKGHQSEIQGLLFDMIAMAEEHHVNMSTYIKIAEKFKQQHTL